MDLKDTMKFICFVIHRVKNLNAIPEVRDKVYDPDPEKVNNTDTLTDLNLNTNHLIDQPFSLDQIHDRCSVIKKNLFLEDKKIKKLKKLRLRLKDNLTTRSGLIIDLEE